MRRAFGAVVMALAFGLVFAPQAAQAQLGGASLSARGDGLQWEFFEPQAPLPPPAFEFDVSDSQADLATGASHALSSIAWPGVTIADGGPAFCGQMGVPYDCPEDPMRAEAFSPGSPHSSKNNQFGPNTSMTAKAGPTGSESAANLQSSDQAKPAVVTGDFTSQASTALAGDQATSEATATVGDITIAGVVHIDSVVSTAQAVTNGKSGTVSGKTEVSGATVNGQAVTIDKSGVHAGGHDAPVFDPINNGQVQQALQQAGISVKVASPVDSLKGASAERTLGGVVVTFQPGAFEDAMPSQLGDNLKKIYQPDQTVVLSIGSVVVSSDTLAGYGGYVPPPAAPSSAGAGGAAFGGGSTAGSSSFSSGGSTVGGGGLSLPVPSGSGSSGTSNGGTVSTTPVSAPLALPPVHGVPAGLAVAAILVALGAALGFRLLAERALAAAAQRCPLEETT